MKKRFYIVRPSMQEMIMDAAREQGRSCEISFSHETGTKWILDGTAYNTGEATAVLSLYL